MLKKIYLFCALFLFIVSLFLGADRFFHHRSSHFCLGKIRTSNLFSSEWGTPVLSPAEKEDLKRILHQKFILYDKSPRSYICVSEDGNYIVKFLKCQHLHRKSWLSYLPFSCNPYYQEFLSKQSKTLFFLNAWKIAFTELKTQTGLIYLHTNNAQPLHQKILVLNKDMQESSIDLDKTLFCVQRHADLTYLRIAQLMQQGDTEGAKRIISGIFSLIDTLINKEIINTDFSFGLVEDRVIQTNLGKLQRGHMNRRQIFLMTAGLKNWLETNHPELFTYFEVLQERCTQRLAD